KRAMSPSSNEKSASLVSWNTLRMASLMMSKTMLWTSSALRAGCSMRFMSPCIRTMGGSPEDRCTSDAPSRCANVNSCVISITPLPPVTEQDARQMRGADVPPAICPGRTLWVGADAAFGSLRVKLMTRSSQAGQHDLHEYVAAGVIERRNCDRV